jgi:phage terminase large subunit-like protein
LHQDTLTLRRQVLGEDHPDTLASASKVAIVLAALGEHERARALADDTLTRRRRVLGDDHPDTRQEVVFLQWLAEHAKKGL